MTTINELIDQTSRAHLPSGVGVAVVMELTLDCGDVGDAVGDADDTRADGVAADAGDDGVAGVLAVAGVPALAVVTDVAKGVAAEPVDAEASTVPVVDAVEAVPTDIAVADVSGLEASVALVATLRSVAGVAVVSCDGLALDRLVDVVSENTTHTPMMTSR